MHTTHCRWNGTRLATFALVALGAGMTSPAQSAPLPGGTLDPTQIPQFVDPLVVPPVMPPSAVNVVRGGKNVDMYEIAVRQFQQQILPAGFGPSTVWGYGSITAPGTVAEGGSFSYPAFTIEARWRRPVRVRWINDLVDGQGDFLPPLFAIDQTLHWANPVGDCRTGISRPDCAGSSQMSYAGPVPLVVHVHGAHTFDHSDGYPEAWFLPGLAQLPPTIQFSAGSLYDPFRLASPLGGAWDDVPGSAVFEYPNDQRATTLWYHDHVLGITRNNVYAGLAGFYLLRGGPSDIPGRLPRPAPRLGDPPGMRYHEIPIAIQDRSFNADGSLFYPEDRAFFEGLAPDQLQIPFIPDPALGGPSDVPPIWNPEFFGNTMVVNGRTWPFLEVERRRYRFRFLNGSNSRFLILRMENGLPFRQIGAEGGFLPAPVALADLLMAPAERADVIVDFTGVPAGSTITLRNFGPDEPFGGGAPGVDFDPADPSTTGRVMQFRVVSAVGHDHSVPPRQLVLPRRTRLDFGLEDQVSADLEQRLQYIGRAGVYDLTAGNFFDIPKTALASHHRPLAQGAGQHFTRITSLVQQPVGSPEDGNPKPMLVLPGEADIPARRLHVQGLVFDQAPDHHSNHRPPAAQIDAPSRGFLNTFHGGIG